MLSGVSLELIMNLFPKKLSKKGKIMKMTCCKHCRQRVDGGAQCCPSFDGKVFMKDLPPTRPPEIMKKGGAHTDKTKYNRKKKHKESNGEADISGSPTGQGGVQ